MRIKLNKPLLNKHVQKHSVILMFVMYSINYSVPVYWLIIQQFTREWVHLNESFTSRLKTLLVYTDMGQRQKKDFNTLISGKSFTLEGWVFTIHSFLYFGKKISIKMSFCIIDNCQTRNHILNHAPWKIDKYIILFKSIEHQNI